MKREFIIKTTSKMTNPMSENTIKNFLPNLSDLKQKTEVIPDNSEES